MARRPRVVLAQWPTPLDQIRHPSLGSIFVKRDDLAGFGYDGRSGVKARKLEGLLAHLKARGVTTLELPLGNITNLGGDLASVSRSAGIRMRFLILDDPPLPPAVREELFRNMDADIAFIGSSWSMAATQVIVHKLSSIGTRRYVALPSPMHPTAAIGAAAGYIEAIEQARAAYGTTPRAVYIAAAAGSTVAGFALGEALMRGTGAPPVEIVAVPVVDQPIALCARGLAYWTAQHFRFGRLRLNLTIARDRRNLRYGRFDRALEQVCDRVGDAHALTIDPIYGGKSWRTMEEREHGRADPRPVIFWHCGYTPRWKSFREELIDG